MTWRSVVTDGVVAAFPSAGIASAAGISSVTIMSLETPGAPPSTAVSVPDVALQPASRNAVANAAASAVRARMVSSSSRACYPD